MNNAALLAEYNSRIKRVIISMEEIDEAIKKAAEDIDAAYAGQPLLLVSIL